MGMNVDQLILDNLKLVPHIVQRYFHASIKRYEDDLIAMGNLGLVKAARTYDPSRGVKFTTYACKCIWQEIYNEFERELKDAVHIPEDVKIRVSKEQGKDALADFRNRFAAASLDTMMEGVDEDADGYDFLASDDEPVEDIAIHNLLVEWALSQMPPKRREKMRVRLENPDLPTCHVGEMLGITRERMRQIQNDFYSKYKYA